MTPALPRRVAAALLLAVPVAIGLGFFVETCGAIHGTPPCGPLSYAAVPFAVLALVLESVIFRSPQNDNVVRLILFLVVYVVAVLICFMVLLLRSPPTRN
jgi:hypothetical protein